jgi:hypothetical protein
MSSEPPERRPVSRAALASLTLTLVCLAFVAATAGADLLPPQVVLAGWATLAVPGMVLAILYGRATRRRPGGLRGLCLAVASLCLLPLTILAYVFLPEARERWSEAIVFSDRTADPLVQNGRAFDKAVLEVGANGILVVPEGARVEDGAPQGRVEIYMEKILSYMGHPPHRMSIRQVRHHMGVARKTEGNKVVIATFGEWDSDIEGGAFMRLLIRVPDGVTVERRAGLSGEASPGRGWPALDADPDPSLTAIPPTCP